MKHKHYEMIVAKAGNMSLVVLAKTVCDKTTGEPIKWSVIHTGEFAWLSDESRDVFLCLPQHKDTCLHWLNGGDIQYQDFPTNEWITLINSTPPCFSMDSIFICDEHNIRPKPRKEKRWICVHTESGEVGGNYYDTKEGCQESINEHYDHSEFQFIEIEVEV